MEKWCLGSPMLFLFHYLICFPLSGNDGKSNMFANAVKWSFPFLKNSPIKG